MVSHTLVFESATKFSEILKKSTGTEALMNGLFGPDFETLCKTHRIRFLVHEESLDGPGKKSRTKLNANEKHFIDELKRMQGAKIFETIVECEMLYGLDFVFLGDSNEQRNQCAVQVKYSYSHRIC